MSKRRLSAAASLCLAVAVLLGAAGLCPAQAPRMTAAQKRVVKALGSPTRLVCREVPLERVVDYLGRLHRIDVEIDRKALQQAGVAADVPVTERLEGISLGSALRLVLRDLELDYVLRGGTIVVTSEEAATERVFAAAYPVGDLVGARAATGAMKLGTKDLVAAIRECIAPGTWRGSGYGDGEGTIRAVPPGQAQFLLVRQTAPVQRRVADFLEHVRYTVRSKRGRPTEAARRASARLAGEEHLRRVLRQPTEMQYIEAPLDGVIIDLRHRYQIPIRIDRRSLDDVGIGDDTPLTKIVSGISLGAALRQLLRQLDLVYVIHNEVVLITTPEDCESRLLMTRLHPVDEPRERRGPAGVYRVDDGWLLDTITSTVRPDTWEDVGGPGGIRVVRKGAVRSLVVTQEASVHEEIDALLTQLRRAAAVGAAGVLPDGTVSQPGAAEKRIRKALAEPTDFAFKETPLQDVVDELADRHAIAIQLDKKALDDVGTGTDTPVTSSLKDVPLQPALRLMLRELDLTFEIRDEVLLITTPEEVEKRLSVKVYPVSDLMPAGRARRDALDALVDVITSTVRPDAWDEVGGPGSVTGLSLGSEKVLVFAQTAEVHAGVAGLFRQLRAIVESPATGDLPKRRVGTGHPDARSASERKIAEALASPTTLEFIETSLEDVVDYLKDLHRIEIQLDKKALDDVGIGAGTPITRNLKGVSLRSGLRLLLRDLDLTYVVQDEVLLITTPEQAECRLDVRLYPVSDLIRRLGGRRPDFDSLVDTITSIAYPDTWDEVGGPGSIAPITVGRAHVLVIAQTADVHQRVAQLLRRLRGAAGLAPTGTPAATQEPTAADKIERALRAPVTLQVAKTPLADVVDQLKRQAGVEIQLDKRSLEDEAIGTDSPVSCDLRRVSLEFALDGLCRKLKLAWTILDDVILITSPEQAESRLTAEVYPVDWSVAGRYLPELYGRDLDSLAEQIVDKLEPKSWEDVGGPGSIVPLSLGRRDVLVVSQTGAVHRRLARMLGRGPYRP